MTVRKRLVTGLAVLFCVLPPASAQSPKFEVASVKPTATTDGSLSVDFPAGGRLSVRNLNLKYLLEMAYSVQDYQISGGPGWIASAGFDIQAAPAPGGPEPPREQVLQMLQTLLADRFQLALRRETRQLPLYALTVAKGGPKLKPAGTDVGEMKTMLGQLIVSKMSMSNLASILSFDLKRPVRDQTGLSGDFAFILEWTPELRDSTADPASRPSLFTAVQEQLGLKLESTQGPLEVLVIDRLEKPSEN
ncbi:MAG TPA: TIGR03435 family protein [Bryobacteraceae bacterium]|jgi:uncharacterized protein (TIGR03435 family)